MPDRQASHGVEDGLIRENVFGEFLASEMLNETIVKLYERDVQLPDDQMLIIAIVSQYWSSIAVVKIIGGRRNVLLRSGLCLAKQKRFGTNLRVIV